MSNFTNIASIDIGSKNPCLYIERVNIDLLHQIKNVGEKNRYNKNKTPTGAFTKILDNVYKNGIKEYLEKFDVSGGSESKIIINMLDYLESKIELFDKCNPIIIEQQVKDSPFNKKLETVCQTFFLYKYGDSKIIVIFPSRYKTQILGMPKQEKKLKPYQKKKNRKQWAINKALEILRLRNDEKTELHILMSKKQDDECDAIVQLQAFKYKCYVDKKL
jgi:nitrogen regulatory protein PII